MIAAGFLANGVKVYITARKEKELHLKAEELVHTYGGECISIGSDLSTLDGIKAFADEIKSKEEHIDFLINNAGAAWAEPFGAFSEGGWDKVMDLNVKSIFFLTQELAPLLRINGTIDDPSRIINIGSMMGTVGVENGNYEGTDFTPATSPLYFYEKGGMHNFTRWAASMLGPFNIRVNCLAPGGFQVPSHPQRFVENYSKRTQLGRMANSSDLKGPIIFLASDSSAYLTGTIIAVDGGYTAK